MEIKTHKPEEIVAKLRQVEVLLGQMHPTNKFSLERILVLPNTL